MNRSEMLQKLAEIESVKTKLIQKLATADLQAVKAKIVEHLIANKVPAHNAQEYVAKRLGSLSLGNVGGGYLLSGTVSASSASQKLGHVVKTAIQSACNELHIQCGVVVNIN